MSLEGGLGLNHSQVISLILDLLLGALSLRPGKHRLFLRPQGFILSPLCDVFGPLCLGQLFLQVDDLHLGNLQLVLSLEQAPRLVLGLFLGTSQA